MNFKSKLLIAAMPIAMGSLMTSCEDSCNNCNCDSYKIDYIVSADSLDKSLSQLYSEETVVIKGTGLSMTKEVLLVDTANVEYSVPLNPTMITDNNIIITLDCEANMISTSSIRLRSNGGCEVTYLIDKPIPAPSIKLFYSEFVPEGDTLRVYGTAFLHAPELNDPMQLWFQDENGKVVNVENFEIAHDNTELLIPVPAGVPDNSRLYLKNSHGESVSPMMFRDTRNIFLDFDKTMASDWHGSMDTLSYAWQADYYNADEIKRDAYDQIFERIKVNSPETNNFPKGCNGYYTALTTSDAWVYTTGENQIFYCQKTQDETAAPRNLLGVFQAENLERLVLKFEVYVPESLPFGSNMYVMFTAYGSEITGESCKAVYPAYACDDHYIPRNFSTNGTENTDYFYDGESQIYCFNSNFGVPGAWFHPGSYLMNEVAGTMEMDKPFSTAHGWMTVAIPLSRDNFKYAIKDRSIATTDLYQSCRTLSANDFYNFYINTDDDKGMQKKVPGAIGNNMFVGFDNFRIVPEDQGGARFDKYTGVKAGSKYPY